MPNLNHVLKNLAEKADPWKDNGLSVNYRNRIQLGNMAELKAFADELGHGQVKYLVRGSEKTLPEISEMTDPQLGELQIRIIDHGVKVEDATDNDVPYSVTLTRDPQSAALPAGV